jgi:hypothetical protein
MELQTKSNNVEARPKSSTKIPGNLDALLTRDALAAALTEQGFPIKPSTLATKATRGGGPPFQLFGRKPLYMWGGALKWAYSRLSGPAHSTSEHRAT